MQVALAVEYALFEGIPHAVHGCAREFDPDMESGVRFLLHLLLRQVGHELVQHGIVHGHVEGGACRVEARERVHQFARAGEVRFRIAWTVSILSLIDASFGRNCARRSRTSSSAEKLFARS